MEIILGRATAIPGWCSWESSMDRDAVPGYAGGRRHQKRSIPWQPKKARNARIRFVPVRLVRRSIAVRNAKRWKKRRTWIASARTRRVQAERNTRPTRKRLKTTARPNPRQAGRGSLASVSSARAPVISSVAFLATKRPQQHRAKYQVNHSVSVGFMHVLAAAARTEFARAHFGWRRRNHFFRIHTAPAISFRPSGGSRDTRLTEPRTRSPRPASCTNSRR